LTSNKNKDGFVVNEFHSSWMELAAWHQWTLKIGSQSMDFHFLLMEGSHGLSWTENQNWFVLNGLAFFVDRACSFALLWKPASHGHPLNISLQQ